jgi:acid phosphatase (class A)
MWKIKSSLLLLVLVMLCRVAAAETNFVPPEHIDLTKILAPAPARGSDREKRDLAEIFGIQKSRTSRQTERALADATAGIFGFADVLGPSFSEQRVPSVAALLGKARADAVAAVGPAKAVWNRQRPYAISSEVETLGDRPESSSYPSDASTVGYLTAILLADMVPEKAVALYARGREFGDDRVILSIHFPSDVEAGRFAATAMANGLLQDPVFVKEFAEAKVELRRALGL